MWVIKDLMIQNAYGNSTARVCNLNAMDRLAEEDEEEDNQILSLMSIFNNFTKLRFLKSHGRGLGSRWMRWLIAIF